MVHVRVRDSTLAFKICVSHDEDYKYYMDQTRTITEIIKEANLTGAKDERLPYPLDNAALSKLDSATEEQKKECSKYPYRRIVGQLMYGMVHTMIGITYALNVLSRYNPGPRHIEFLNICLSSVSAANSIDSSSIHATGLQTSRQ